MNLHVEIADLSFGGTVHFEDLRFANVTLEHGAVVSTTLNDYQQADASGFHLTYYAADDAAYDVQTIPVTPDKKGVFAEDFLVVNETMSDCLYLLSPPGTVLPGCSKNTLNARNRVKERSLNDIEEVAALLGHYVQKRFPLQQVYVETMIFQADSPPYNVSNMCMPSVHMHLVTVLTSCATGHPNRK